MDAIREAELREIFKEMDMNGDGRITTGELEVALIQVGEKPSNMKIAELMKQADTDGNGCIEIDEFLSVFKRQLMDPREEREMRQVFEYFDRNGDGLISMEELSQVMRSLGESMTPSEIRAMIREGDIDHDGSIDFNEFVCLMKGAAR